MGHGDLFVTCHFAPTRPADKNFINIGILVMHMNLEEKNRVTLCARCVNDFYDTNAFDIRRDFRSQEVGRCCYCNSRMGFDYFVMRKKKPIRQRKEA